MINTKLIHIYSTLQQNELKQLHKFVISPFHNKHKDVIALFEFLRKQRQLTEKTISNEKVFAHLFPKKKFDGQKLRYVISYALKTIEDFLVYEERNRDAFKNNIDLVRAYRKRKLEKNLSATLNSMKRLEAEEGRVDRDFYYNKFLLKQELFDHKAMKTRTAQLNLQELSDDLDIYFIVSKLKIACNAQTHKNLFVKNYELRFLDDIITRIEKDDLAAVPLIGAYYNVYKTQTEYENEHYFENLKDLLIQNGNTFSRSEIRDVYLMAINYCIKKLNDGNEKYLREVFNLYQMTLENEVILIDQKLSPFTYKNIVSAGIKLKEYDWVESFIEDYYDRLEADHPESYYAYNKAHLKFELNQFDEAIDIINRVEFKDFFSSLSARVILLKSFYELNEFELLDPLITNFRHLLGRKKMINYYKINYTNFTRMMKRLLRVNVYDKAAIEKLRKTIEETEILTEKPWFLEKIAGMK